MNSPARAEIYFLRFLFGACVKAEPATLFAAFDDRGFLKIFAAWLATLFEVFSELHLRLDILCPP